MAQLDIEAILEYMPHRYPFLLVDRILEFTPGERIVGLKNVTFNEPYFAGHFPGHPIMPGVLIVEAMAQAGGLLLLNEVDEPESKVVYFMSMDGVKFRKPVVPGDQLIFEVEMVKKRSSTCKVRGVSLVDGQKVAEATMTARIVDR
jgi:UDP-3-O-[3-hydroxymyristoyl] N-acetylglucosamine deacetylase/3-hydroxyacyl-[acyl-carrier-protein] dehydratase